MVTEGEHRAEGKGWGQWGQRRAKQRPRQEMDSRKHIAVGRHRGMVQREVGWTTREEGPRSVESGREAQVSGHHPRLTSEQFPWDFRDPIHCTEAWEIEVRQR